MVHLLTGKRKGFIVARVSRFDCPSLPLVLGSLLRRARCAAWVCFGLGLLTHFSLIWIGGPETQEKASKPLTTHFVKREPRLSKALELKKRPHPRRRQIQRKMVAVKARMPQEQASVGFEAAQVLTGVARPGGRFARVEVFAGPQIERASLSYAVQGSKEVQQKIDLSLELLDIEALDTGEHHALVIQDPQDRTGIRGFCHLAIVFSRALYPRGAGDQLSFDRYILPGFLRLVEAVNSFTDIKADMLGRVALGDAKILKTPWLLFGTHDRLNRPSTTELENLGTYLVSGGFVFADCYNYFNQLASAGYLSLRNIVLGALAAHGIQNPFEIVPNDHPLYHCYFDFDGPPIANDGANRRNHPEFRIIPYLEGMEVEGRLAVVLSGKLMYRGWAFGTDSYTKDLDPTRPLQFGVNTVIFALTQEGSITHRLMESVAY